MLQKMVYMSVVIAVFYGLTEASPFSLLRDTKQLIHFQERSLLLGCSVVMGLPFWIRPLTGGENARRCSEMLRDQPCVVQGTAPLKLHCDYKTGKFFQIKSPFVKYRSGVWTEVIDAQALANTECRNSRDLDINLEYYCTVTEKSLCPYADRMRNVKIEYFCWELDPDLLSGFVTDEGGWVK